MNGPVRTTEQILQCLNDSPDELARLVGAAHDADALRRPANDGGWGVVEILAHLRDWEAIYFERARRIVAESHPHLPGVDDTLWPIERDYRGQDPHESLEQFAAARGETVAFLRSLPSEAWMRTGEHGYYGTISLQWMGDHICTHDDEHAQQAREALAG
jgi:hypothetical protein